MHHKIIFKKVRFQSLGSIYLVMVTGTVNKVYSVTIGSEKRKAEEISNPLDHVILVKPLHQLIYSYMGSIDFIEIEKSKITTAAQFIRKIDAIEPKTYKYMTDEIVYQPGTRHALYYAFDRAATNVGYWYENTHGIYSVKVEAIVLKVN